MSLSYVDNKFSKPTTTSDYYGQGNLLSLLFNSYLHEFSP